MLPSLSIKNFRNLENLKIASLSRVNLITGKNNTGKSTLLEAVSIYASRCDLAWINFLLNERGEYFIPLENSLNSLDLNIKTFSSLFTRRVVGFSNNDTLSIGLINDDESPELRENFDTVSIRFVKYFYETATVASAPPYKTIVQENRADQISDSHMGLVMSVIARNSYILSLDDVKNLRLGYRSITPPDKYQLIRVRNIDREINSKLWDTITLTEKEVHVIEALKIIEPGIERLAFIGDEGRERTAVVKLNGDSTVNPIRSMGDGINRILTIILALVNSDNGYLLIDEFENGLHYSVQEKLWEIIFKLSKKLNVQVFATTHSEDCIRGFESALNDHENYNEGKLIRLDNFKGKIRQTEYSPDELKVASENFIETR